MAQIENYLGIEFPTKEDSSLEHLEGISTELFSKIKGCEMGGITWIEKGIETIEKFKLNDKIWINTYNKKAKEYKKYLQEHGMEDIIDETNKLKEHKAELNRIKNIHEPKIKSTVEKLLALQAERKKLLAQFCRLNEKLTKKRKNTGKEVTESDEVIRITISKSKNFEAMKTFLSKALVGRNVHEKQIENIVSTGITGAELAQFIKENNLNGLIDKTATTSHTTTELSSVLAGTIDLGTYGLSPISSQLFALELIWPTDEALLEIFDKDAKTYRSFSAFSPGQQCSTLLNILLKASDKPLIIDQPEDEQDWFYVGEFIEQLRQAKCSIGNKSRQFIFVTHDQNIPVLADSEKVFKVKNIPVDARKGHKRGGIEASGGVEREEVKEAILSLEGGEEAFRARGAKYGLSFRKRG